MITLQNILNSEGQEFLDNLLNKKVIVTEKLNASTLSFQKKETSEMDMNRKLTFYKGSGINKREITIADRVMTNFFSTGTTYLSNLSKIIMDKIPGNWTFVCKYFPGHQPSFINYSVLPKNNLVLSCIITSGGTKIEDEDDLRPWAEMFDIAYQEPVFKGYLTQYQKERLNDYLRDGSENDSFSRFIITLLNPSLTHSLYQNDGFNSPIDGFIFKFVSDDGVTKPMSAKLIDPYMTNIIAKNKSSKGFKDNTDVLLSDFAVFMTGQDLDSIILKSEDDGERYLELFYRLFNRYIKYKKSQLEDFDVDTNEIVKESIDTEFNVDIDKISNETTKKLLKENPEYKSIFKTLLGSFKSKKPENYKSIVMSPGVVRIFNDVIDKVNSKISEKEEESNFTFSSYMDIMNKKRNTEEPSNDVARMNKEELTPSHQIGQAMSFADFKKKDEKKEEKDEEKREMKSIEDLIKDLKKDVESLKSEVKDQKKEQNEEKSDKEESEGSNDGGNDGSNDKSDVEKESPKPENKEDEKGNENTEDGGDSDEETENGSENEDKDKKDEDNGGTSSLEGL